MGGASNPVPNSEQDQTSSISALVSIPRKKQNSKKIPVPGFAPGSLAIAYTVIGGQRVAITLYGLSNCLTVRPRGCVWLLLVGGSNCCYGLYPVGRLFARWWQLAGCCRVTDGRAQVGVSRLDSVGCEDRDSCFFRAGCTCECCCSWKLIRRLVLYCRWELIYRFS